jgi:osmotically-inducible protein OsmY
MRVLAGLLSIVVAAALAEGRTTLAQKSASDARIAASVRRALAASGVDVSSVEVSVERAVVSLRGEVNDAREKVWLIEAAFAIADVQAVDSALVLRHAATPAVEEGIWLALLDEGLDRFLSEVLVRDGVASIRGEVPDASTLDRILVAVRSVAGVESVQEEIDITPATDVLPPSSSQPSPPEAPPVVSMPPQTAAPEPAAPEPAAPEPAAPEPAAPEPAAPEPAAPEPAAPEPAAPEPTASVPMPAEAVPSETLPPESGTAESPPTSIPEPIVASPAPVAPPPSPPPVKDATPSMPLVRQIVAGILGYPGYTVFDHVQFGIEGRDVVLRGVVTEPSKKRELEETLRAITGIGEIDNEIRILPDSDADRKLREQLFRRIYEDSLFAEFASERNPPIHILVEDGWVTLTGVVDEVLQKMSAEAMVRNVFGVISVRNRIRVRE